METQMPVAKLLIKRNGEGGRKAVGGNVHCHLALTINNHKNTVSQNCIVQIIEVESHTVSVEGYL